LKTTLLAGKSFDQLLNYVKQTKPWLMVLGRIGVHSEAGMDLGSATENLLRQASCNLLLSARCFEPPIEHIAETTMSWTEEAEARMLRIPDFARSMARKAIIKHAASGGHTIVTSDVIDSLMSTIPQGAVNRHADNNGVPPESLGGAGSKCPFAPRQGESNAVPQWSAAALARLDRIEPAAMRDHARLRIEKMALRQGAATITEELVESASRAVAEMLA
jgi:hypothetical protein